jgi:hypothetical protein
MEDLDIHMQKESVILNLTNHTKLTQNESKIT